MARASKVRLVVGLLGTVAELVAALGELGDQGLKPARITVVAQAEAFSGALAAWWEGGAGPISWIICRPVADAIPWSAVAAAPDGDARRGPLDDVRALLGLHHWALQRQARQLHLHLEQGSALLVVEPDTEAEELAACTALLHHASGGVQTHEIGSVPS